MKRYGLTIYGLSLCETTLFGFILEGLTQKEIAELTGKSLKTVEMQAKNIKKKMGARTMAHAAYLAGAAK